MNIDHEIIVVSPELAPKPLQITERSTPWKNNNVGKMRIVSHHIRKFFFDNVVELAIGKTRTERPHEKR